MLIAQRKKSILEKLETDGQITIVSLSEELGISEDTVRRDLDDLARGNLLKRVRGGAVPISLAVGNFHVRETLSSEEKKRIGRYAAKLIQPGNVILVDGGTTTRELVRSIPKDFQATIITHSPTIAIELIDHHLIEVVLIGGKLFKHSMVTMGTSTIEAIDKITPDVFFLGATGIHSQSGVTTGDWEEAGIKRRMCECATEVYLLVSPEKLDKISPYKIIPIKGLTGMILPAEISEEKTKKYADMGLRICKVS